MAGKTLIIFIAKHTPLFLAQEQSPRIFSLVKMFEEEGNKVIYAEGWDNSLGMLKNMLERVEPPFYAMIVEPNKPPQEYGFDVTKIKEEPLIVRRRKLIAFCVKTNIFLFTFDKQLYGFNFSVNIVERVGLTTMSKKQSFLNCFRYLGG
jgi:hypothetical protein